MSKQSKFHIMRLWLGHGVYPVLLGSLGFYVMRHGREGLVRRQGAHTSFCLDEPQLSLG